ncbi:hypothetical protein NN561_005708 [Cricetulus griseus]
MAGEGDLAPPCSGLPQSGLSWWLVSFSSLVFTFPTSAGPAQETIQVHERPKALEAELHLTLQVLENVTDSALYPILEQPLHTLRHIHSQLQACIQPEPAAEPRPPSHRLSRWLHRLREAQEKEESRLQKDVRCSPKLFPRRWKLVRLQVQERLKALQAELHLTLQVLENVTDSALYRILEQPLHTLRHIHSQLQACIQPEPAAEPRPPSHRLSRWLHRLREAQEKETPGCLEISVTSNLLRLLIQDLRCVAREDQCA